MIKNTESYVAAPAAEDRVPLARSARTNLCCLITSLSSPSNPAPPSTTFIVES